MRYVRPAQSQPPRTSRNYMRDTHSFTHLGGYRGTSYDLATTGCPRSSAWVRMSGEVFPALQVAPLLGRTFTQARRRATASGRRAQL